MQNIFLMSSWRFYPLQRQKYLESMFLATGLLDIGFNILSQGRVSELVGGVGPSNHPPPQENTS